MNQNHYSYFRFKFLIKRPFIEIPVCPHVPKKYKFFWAFHFPNLLKIKISWILIFPQMSSPMCAANMLKKLLGFYCSDWYYSGKFGEIYTLGKFCTFLQYIFRRKIFVQVNSFPWITLDCVDVEASRGKKLTQCPTS